MSSRTGASPSDVAMCHTEDIHFLERDLTHLQSIRYVQATNDTTTIILKKINVSFTIC